MLGNIVLVPKSRLRLYARKIQASVLYYGRTRAKDHDLEQASVASKSMAGGVGREGGAAGGGSSPSMAGARGR